MTPYDIPAAIAAFSDTVTEGLKRFVPTIKEKFAQRRFNDEEKFKASEEEARKASAQRLKDSLDRTEEAKKDGA